MMAPTFSDVGRTSWLGTEAFLAGGAAGGTEVAGRLLGGMAVRVLAGGVGWIGSLDKPRALPKSVSGRDCRGRNTCLLWDLCCFTHTKNTQTPSDMATQQFLQPAFLEGSTSTEDAAARTAQMWLSNPLNRFSLPSVNKAADADGDGLLDKDEFAGLFDLDGDGQVSAAEAAKAKALFAMVDKDGDGQLTEEELKQVSAPPPHPMQS